MIQWVDTGIFPATIMFIHRFEYDEVMAHLKKTKAVKWHMGLSESKSLIDGGEYFGLKRTVFKKGEKDVELFYVWLKKPFLFTDWCYCKLAHEVLHICQFLLPAFLDRDREYECEAYLHTHIMEQCLNHLRGKKIK